MNRLMKVKSGKNEMSLALHEEVCSTRPAADLSWLKLKSKELLEKYRIKS
jgi:hypothetical protein